MITLDAYSRRARLAPAVLVVLPVGLTFAAWFPENTLGWGLLSGLLSTCGITLLLAEVGRDQGKRKEQQLAQKWSGLATLKLLRHRDELSTPETRRRYHARLQMLLPELHLPDIEEELAQPTQADRVYQSCAEYLRERTRNPKQFPLVYQENASYGFRRNLWAMKPMGLTFATLGLLGGGLRVAFSSEVTPLALSAPLINAFLLALWLVRINPDWVKLAADAYAQRLLAACEEL